MKTYPITQKDEALMEVREYLRSQLEQHAAALLEMKSGAREWDGLEAMYHRGCINISENALEACKE